MNRRSFVILAVVTAALALLAVLGQRGDGDSIAGDSAGEPVLPGLAGRLDEVVGITMTGAGRERLVTLAADDDGWRVAELGGYPAETGRINGLLIALGEARIVEEKTADPAYYDRLGVEPVDGTDATGLELELQTGDGDAYAIVLGAAYGNDERYARRGDGERSYLIDRDPEVARNAADWVEPGIIDIPGERIQRVTIRHADGEVLVLEKAARAEPNFSVADLPEGRELEYAGVADVTAEVLESLNLEEVAPRSPTDTEPLVVADFVSFDGLVVSVTAAAPDTEAEADADAVAADGAAWLEFSATVDAGQAAAYADENQNEDGSPDTAAVEAEAAALNARLGDWRYRIASFKYSQLTRRLESLLSSLPDADADAE